ncbi:hypothetical protein YC2023_000416 [Brassica napus]
MEERRRDAGGTLASAGSSGDSPASEPTPRRRVKRKSNALGASNSSSTSSKRMLTREKAMLASFSPVHNGPLTRARQAPSNMPSATEAKPELLSAPDGEKPKEEEERNKAIREWEALEAKIEADFEGIRSRGSNVHVVPNHCGWFSWGKIHPLEERSLPSFFNGKLEGRSSDVYIEIRDWIMRKFHSDPNTQIEGKHLTELEVGDVEAKQEVMEFLDYWGLINFHPFPPPDASSSDGGERDDGVGDKESLLNSLYRFQADEASSMAAFVQKPRLTAQATTTPSGLFPDPMAAADDSLKQEGPAVEYHCNSCSADCSLKRYHCPKQADFDLCMECFDSGKFSSDMSSSDFILLEPAKDPGVGSGKWTDQETLLLLEGIEIFKENWSEIAEHVATKTKAQCMLHFLQMPIEDAFLDQTDHKDPSIKDTTDIAVSKDEKPVLNDAPVEKEKETENTNLVVEVEAVKEAPEKEDDNEGKVPQESSKPGDASEETKEVEADQKTPEVEIVIDERCKDEADENVALKALTEAFEDVGYPITPEASLSFADLGNPVMGLAAFLVRLAGSDVATASARASVKSLNSNSGLLLATRHCFVLEDPPENKEDLTESKSVDAEEKSQKAEDDREMTDSDPGKVNQDSVSEGKQPGSLTESYARNPDSEGQKVSINAAATKNSEKPADIICKLQDKSSGKELEKPSKDGDKLSSENKAASKATVSKAAADVSQPEASKDVEMKDTLQSEKDPQDMVKTAGEKAEQAKEDDHSMPDTSVAEQPIGSASLPENGTGGENLNKEGSKEKNVCAGKKDKHNSGKLKRAAISALSAAAVKAKHLAKLEEDQIRQLSGSLIEKQLHKLEAKLSIFNDAESLTARVREQLERSRQRLYHERAQIIAARLGVPPSVSSKASLPANRIATNFANVAHRPPIGMAFPRPPMPRPPGP